MKPSPFEYRDPENLEDALATLAEYGDEAKILAGGQSLVPLLNFRLASPTLLVDVNDLPGLSAVRISGGTLNLGATARQSWLELSPAVAEGWPLLPAAIRWVAHRQIRNRGTVGGSLAHADPAAELPVVMRCLDARFHVRSQAGERTIDADDMFVTHLTTSLEPDEMLVGVEVPAMTPGTGWSFKEFSRRSGDFALAGVALTLNLDDEGRGSRAAVTLLASADIPLRDEEMDSLLVGREVDRESAAELGALAAEKADLIGGTDANVKYRRKLIRNLVEDAVLEAAERATERNEER